MIIITQDCAFRDGSKMGKKRRPVDCVTNRRSQLAIWRSRARLPLLSLVADSALFQEIGFLQGAPRWAFARR